MKDNEIPAKPYDAIEDAIDMSKKDPNKTWDDLLRKSPTTERPVGDKDSQDGRVAASTESRSLYRIR